MNHENVGIPKMHYSRARNLTVLILCSVVGLFMFFVPISGRMPLEWIYRKAILEPASSFNHWLALGFILLRLFLYIYGKYFAKEGSYFHDMFALEGKGKLVVYIIAVILIVMVVFQIGPHWLNSDKAAGFMVFEVFPFTISILLVAGVVLPFLTSFGLLEIVGSFLEPVMRPLLRLPGKAAIDTIASVVGAAVTGIFITATMYKRNEYTQKEALSIASGFSLNSVGYCAFLVGYVGLGQMFGSLFLIYLFIAYVVGAIVVRIPPISKHKDVYFDGTVQPESVRKERVKYSRELIRKGYENALLRADSQGGVFMTMVKGFVESFFVISSLLPIMIVIGGFALAIYNFTPVVDYLSMPFIPIVKLLGVPDATLAAKAVFTGGIELFVPSMLVTAGTEIMATRFFVVMVTMMQVLYITETMLPIKQFGIPVKLWELILIWFIRTILLMPPVALVMHLLF